MMSVVGENYGYDEILDDGNDTESAVDNNDDGNNIFVENDHASVDSN